MFHEWEGIPFTYRLDYNPADTCTTFGKSRLQNPAWLSKGYEIKKMPSTYMFVLHLSRASIKA